MVVRVRWKMGHRINLDPVHLLGDEKDGQELQIGWGY